VPGSDGGAELGLPDLLFFALYLGAAARWKLRVGWTWVCLTRVARRTMALATWLDVDGLPALPLLSVGFLLPNADLLWRAVRRSERATESPSKSDVTQASPPPPRRERALADRESCARRRSWPGRRPRPCRRRCSAPRAAADPGARERVRPTVTIAWTASETGSTR
jgi:hypothetical protein